MRAMVATRWCEPSELEYLDVPDPQPGTGEVLVETRAIGCNFPDILMVQGKYQVKPPLPFSPGHEVAGVVRAVGGGVTRARPGQRVIAMLGWGAYAELVVAPAARVFPIPQAMSFEEAAAFGLVYQTAYCALVHRAALQPGEWLLVHGAAGGVGLAAVEMGKALGATVIATAGDRDKLAVAKAHGADHLIDYRGENIRDRVKEICNGGGVDVVFDPVGGTAFEASLRCVNWGARLIVVGFAGGQLPQVPANILLVKNIAAIGFYWGSYRHRQPALVAAQFRELFDWWQDQRLKPLVSHRFDLTEAPAALALLRERKSTGKVVLTLRDRT